MARTIMRIALVVVVASVARSASAQIDLSGEWAGTFYEDLPHRGGVQLGDYTGLPLNEAGWRKAQSWDEAVVATHQDPGFDRFELLEGRSRPRRIFLELRLAETEAVRGLTI